MDHTFNFKSIVRADERELSIYVVFISDPHIRSDHLTDLLSTELRRQVAPDYVLILGNSVTCSLVENVLASADFTDRFSEYLMARIPRFISARIDEFGAIHLVGGEPHPLDLNDVWKRAKHDGMVDVFVRRNALLEASKLYHFEKPSGAHSDKFIRTAEILVSDPEISFIGSCLLSLFSRSDLRYVFCDTSSLAVVCYSAFESLRIASQSQFPRVHSFSSYLGVENLDRGLSSSSLYLVSASTSGGLARRIQEVTQASEKSIITLYYLGEGECLGQVICDLRVPRSGQKKGFDPILSYSGSDCRLCMARQSIPLHILGDQFLVREPKIEAIVVNASDAPSWLPRFMRDIHSRRVLRCYYGGFGRERPREIFIDFEELLNAVKANDSGLPEKFKRMVSQSIPIGISRIIYSDDEGSALFAEYVAALVRGRFRDHPIELLSAHDFTKAPEKHVRDQGSTLVVASCLVSGRSLLGISQCLRNCQMNDQISYLIAVARPQLPSELDGVKSNLA